MTGVGGLGTAVLLAIAQAPASPAPVPVGPEPAAPAPAGRTAAALAQPAAAVGYGQVTGRVRVDSVLNVRSNASTWHRPVAQLADRAPVPAQCRIGGESVSGSVGTGTQWLRIGARRYVSDAYVEWSPAPPELPWCDYQEDQAPRPRERFIDWAAGHAGQGRRDYQVPVSVTVAQAINESGWGRSALTGQGNSYFGIKCFGTPGPLAAGCRPYDTSECDQSGCFPTVATFRVFNSAADSFDDHGRFLTVNPRYQPAFDHTDDPDRFAREIHRAGYATDPNYSDKLIALMREYDLYRFDD